MIFLIQNIVLSLLLNTYVMIFHSIHISYGEAIVSGNEMSGKITFYKDDFMKALKKLNSNSLRNLTDKQFDEMKLKYLRDHLAVYADGRELTLTITHNNENESSIWFNFKFTYAGEINTIEIKNNSLIEEFSDQMNLLNISSSSSDQSLIFTDGKQKQKIEL